MPNCSIPERNASGCRKNRGLFSVRGRAASIMALDGLTFKQISAYYCLVRRKPGTLIPIEQEILAAALRLRQLGNDEFHGFRIAKEIKGQTNARLLTGHGTLYRALGRLEQLGLLQSRWEDPAVAAQQKRSVRKLYRLTGAEVEQSGSAYSRGTGGSLRLREQGIRRNKAIAAVALDSCQ